MSDLDILRTLNRMERVIDRLKAFDIPAGSAPASSTSQAIFTISGNLSVLAGTLRIYNQLGRTVTISEVFLSANTAPLTSAIIADVHKGGTTIFTNQANRPQIAASANTGNTTTIDVPSWADGEYLTVDIDQIGTGTVGADFTAHIIYS